MRSGDHHRRDLGGIVGPLVVVEGHEPVHKGPGSDQGYVAQLAGADLLFRHQPTSAEALRVADHRVHSGFLDGGEDTLGIGEPGRERLLDQQRQLALHCGENRLDVQVLVGRDDRGRHLGAREKLAVVLCHEIGANFLPDLFPPIGFQLREADKVDLRVARRDLAAEQADSSAADDRETDASGVLLWH